MMYIKIKWTGHIVLEEDAKDLDEAKRIILDALAKAFPYRYAPDGFEIWLEGRPKKK